MLLTKYHIAAAAITLMAACVDQLTTPDKSDLAIYQADLTACNSEFAPSKSAIDACKESIRKAWYEKWNREFDGGFGQ